MVFQLNAVYIRRDVIMCENFAIENFKYEIMDDESIKKLNDQDLLQMVKKTNQFLKLSEIYKKDVRDDYGKQKIANLRVEFVRHQLKLLTRECFARGIKHGINSYYPI